MHTHKPFSTHSSFWVHKRPCTWPHGVLSCLQVGDHPCIPSLLKAVCSLNKILLCPPYSSRFSAFSLFLCMRQEHGKQCASQTQPVPANWAGRLLWQVACPKQGRGSHWQRDWEKSCISDVCWTLQIFERSSQKIFYLWTKLYHS